MTRTRKLLTTAAPLALLLAMTATGAAAQSPPPEHYTLDPRGVDLVAGTFNYGATEVVIGQPGAGGMTYGRAFVGGIWRDSFFGAVTTAGSDKVVSIGAISEVFIPSGGGYVSKYDNGSTYVTASGITTVTDRNGNVAVFDAAVGDQITSYSKPDGEVYTYHWKQVSGYPAIRLQSVTNNYGYLIKYQYRSNVPGASDWEILETVTGMNLKVDWCDPDGDTCPTPSQVWPSMTYNFPGFLSPPTTATDQSGRTTTYSYVTGNIATIQYPESTSPDVTVAYSGAFIPYYVSDVTDASGHWTYGFSTAGTTQTTAVAGPLSQAMTVISDLTIGRASSVTDAQSNTWSYQYDGDLRLTRATQPETDYQEYTYDGRGNVTQIESVPKAGSPLSSITINASYPASCSSPGVTVETCNKPLTTTDGRGAVTDYEWDTTTGQIVSVTAPAPSLGADRPQVRYTYSAEQARYHDTASTFANGAAISKLSSTSSCATGEWDPLASPAATCDTGAGEEIVTSIAYPTTANPNNLQPDSISRGSGATPSMSTVALTYTADGDVETVDGPLFGADDTVEYFYDDARQVTGAVGPDPDGGVGPLANRAQRFTYNDNGQTTLAETGTTSGYSDPSVSGFTPLLQSQTTYDPAAFNRPMETRQLDGSTGVSGVQQVEYDAAGRVSCTAVRMDPATFTSPTPLPAACTATTTRGFGPDRIVHTAYDAVGRPTSVTSGYGTGDALTVSTTYTDNGKTESLTDGQSHVSIIEYDGFDRPVKLRYPNTSGSGTSTTDYEAWTWNADGQPNDHRGRDGQTTSFGWDLLGRNTDVVSPSGTMSTTAAFDNLGRRTSITGNSLTVNTAWDPLSRMTSESISGIGSMDYGYDAAGRLLNITWPDGFAVAYGRDTDGGIRSIVEAPPGNIPVTLATYTYDDLGMLTGVSRANGATSTYGYDGFSRLTSLAQDATGAGVELTLGYSYNPAGQIVGRTVSNDSYVYTPSYGGSYARNGLNQVTAINASSVTYDSNQNTTGVSGNTYGYDAQGRLTSASAGAGATTLVYDPLGRLHDSTVGANQTVYVYAGDQLAAEYDGSGAMVNRYVPGLGLDDVVTSYAGSGTGTRSWQMTDERGSVVMLTNGVGKITQGNAYDEYGAPAPGNDGRFQYTGQPWMPEAKAYNYRARAYLPELGRFLQTDPAGYAAGQNVYAYVGLDPLNFRDSLGLGPDDECVPDETGTPICPDVPVWGRQLSYVPLYYGDIDLWGLGGYSGPSGKYGPNFIECDAAEFKVTAVGPGQGTDPTSITQMPRSSIRPGDTAIKPANFGVSLSGHFSTPGSVRNVLGNVTFVVDWPTAVRPSNGAPQRPVGFPVDSPLSVVDVLGGYDQLHAPGNQIDVYGYEDMSNARAGTRTVMVRTIIPRNTVGVSCPVGPAAR